MTVQFFNGFIPSDNKIAPGEKNKASGPPEGCSGLQSVTPEIVGVANKLLSGAWGTITPFKIDDNYYLGRVEPHPPHEEGHPSGLTSWHKGVSIYKLTDRTKLLKYISEEPKEDSKPEGQEASQEYWSQLDNYLDSIQQQLKSI